MKVFIIPTKEMKYLETSVQNSEIIEETVNEIKKQLNGIIKDI